MHFCFSPVYLTTEDRVPNFDKKKVYTLQSLVPGMVPITDLVVPGDHLEETINDCKSNYPYFKKIVVYDAETKEAVAIIKPE